MSITTHQSNLASPYYEYVKNGTKIYELRLYDYKRKLIKINNLWHFSSNNKDKNKNESFTTKVIGIKIYKSFREAIEDTGLKQLLPQISDLEEGINIYESFDNNNYKINAEIYCVVRFTLQTL